MEGTLRNDAESTILQHIGGCVDEVEFHLSIFQSLVFFYVDCFWSEDFPLLDFYGLFAEPDTKPLDFWITIPYHNVPDQGCRVQEFLS